MKIYLEKPFILVVGMISLLLLIRVMIIDEVGAEEKTLEKSVFLKGNTEEELIIELKKRVIVWKEQPIQLIGDTTQIELPSNAVQFLETQTIKEFMKKNKKNWYNLFSDKYEGYTSIKVDVDEEVVSKLDNYYYLSVDEIIESIKEHATQLKNSPIPIVENKMILESMPRLSFSNELIESGVANIEQYVKLLNQKVINPGEELSFIDYFKEQDLSVDAPTLSYLATVFNQAAMKSFLTVVERHTGQEIPITGEPGLNAQINLIDRNDYRVVNTSEFPILIRASINNNKLLISLYSFDDETNYSLTINKEIVGFKTIFRYSNKLKGNQQRLLMAGKSGLAVNIVQVESRGIFESEKNIGRAYYPPINQIIEIAAELTDSEEKINEDGNHGELIEDLESKNPEEVDRDVNGQPVSPAIDEQPLTDKGGNLINE